MFTKMGSKLAKIAEKISEWINFPNFIMLNRKLDFLI